MILIDALYINNGGAKILLDYMMKQLDRMDLKVLYILDERIKNKHYQIEKSKSEVQYLKANIVKRHLFYKKNKKLISSVLCFANIPPTIKLNANVYTYFHQTLYLKNSGNESLKKRLLLILKSSLMAFYKRNTAKWIVQTNAVKKDLARSISLNIDVIMVLPFYPPMIKNKYETTIKNKNSFIFVSNGNPHKNHILLLKAFQKIYLKGLNSELHITVSESNSVLIKFINTLIMSGVPIINHGFVPREKIAELYSKIEYCIYPSIRESFGLGLIEAMESNCKVIASDLPYVHAICKPSLVFNPYSVDSIEQAMETVFIKHIPDTQQLVHNQIEDLIALLKNHETNHPVI